MDKISINDFNKVEMRMGKIIEASEVEGSGKLIKMKVDFGDLGMKIVFSGIKKWYKPETLVNKTTLFAVNIEPKEVFGEMSEAMIVAAEDDNGICLLIPEASIKIGSKVY